MDKYKNIIQYLFCFQMMNICQMGLGKDHILYDNVKLSGQYLGNQCKYGKEMEDECGLIIGS